MIYYTTDAYFLTYDNKRYEETEEKHFQEKFQNKLEISVKSK